jgi:porphobilinogen synthase
MITGKYPSLRLRRTRKYNWSRRLIQENNLSSSDLIYPIFLIEGKNKKQAIKSMPGIYRYSIDQLGMIVIILSIQNSNGSSFSINTK